MAKKKTVEIDAREPREALADRLEVRYEIGAGGMCAIREAHDHNLLRTSAFKVLHPDLAGDTNTRRRMIEEAQITAQLDHPNIVPVYELGETNDGNLFFTMKLVEGKTLAEVIDEFDFAFRTENELYEQLQILIKVCNAVAFAHSYGVIHRDLKPDNIMLGDFGAVYLMDWGIAKLRDQAREGSRRTGSTRMHRRARVTSQDNHCVGTPHYMSPEQARGDHDATDERSDVFSLGAILYELLVQVPPHDDEDIMQVLEMAKQYQVKPPEQLVEFSLPPRLCQIAMKALAKDQAERYQTVLEMRDDLTHFMQSGWQFEVQEYEPGGLIVKEGDRGDCAYIVVRGRCRVFKVVDDEQVALADLEPGTVFGETAVFADEPRNATVQALDHVVVRVVPREYFEEDLGMGLSMGLFVRALARRFNERNREAAELGLELEVSELFNQIFKYLIFSGESTHGGRREARWSSLCSALEAQYNRDEEWLLSVIQDDPLFEVDIGRDIVSVGKL